MTLQQNEGFEIPTWKQVYAMLLELAQKIRIDAFSPDIIVGVSRGGWAPARVLSDLLENPNMANVKAEFYLGVAETKKTPTITQSVSTDVVGKTVLVVDDVSDTGRSLRLVKSHLMKKGVNELRIATLYYKPWSVTTPDYYEKTTRHWIIFPWERKEAFRKVAEKFALNGKSAEEASNALTQYGFDSELADRFLREYSEG
ncbi:MAG: phosphoribosyltransferase [Candidatus Bathyarchaeota archaeon]|nr:MAG: phosphoribosyltransferase [Candidatus Bathyarchaeota archaeon]